LFYFPKKSNGLALGSPLNRYDTNLRKASAYTGAPIPYTTIVSDASNPSTITVTTPYAHGLQPGTPLLIQLTSGSTNFTDYGSGPFAILSTPTLTTFTVQAKTGAAVTGTLGGTIIIKPNSSFLHRPFDGGIAMTCGSPHHGALAARQTKKYFRYQSGKGMFFTSGTLFAPTFDISTASASNVNVYGSITISTEQNHQLQIGAVVRLSGFNTGGYNGTYRVTSITSDRAFTVQIYQTLASTIPVFAPQPRVNVTGWYGGVVRAGLFDDQNGVFWEYDGEQLTVVKRSSTYQVAGLASVQANSNLVTGDGTCRWNDQLAVGDAIVIRGMTHTITSIPDHNTMTVVPEYRGTNNDTRIKILLVLEQRIKQADFNVDVMDSTGPSGYLIDPAKMQMIMIQYTWYGAGFIEFGVRGPNGKFILSHRIKNNNVNDEAYMRSGNLPCRYEASSNGALTKLFGNINSSQTSIQIQDGTFFPANVSVQYPAYISVNNEIVGYTSITKEAYGQGNLVANLTLLTRGTGIGTQLTQWVEGSSKTFTQGANVGHTTGSGVYVIGCTSAPTLTHWGSAVVMDGGYDVDKGYSFSFIRNNVTLPSSEGQKTTLFLMRLAPSVSNTIIGAIGTRDLINRAALDLNGLVVNITGGRYLIEGILNPTNLDLHTTTFVNLNAPQFGNQPSFTQFSTNVQFTGTTLGGLLPSALSASGTGTARGGLRSNAVSYSGTFAAGGTTYWANNVPVSAYTTGGGTGAFATVRITTNTFGNANIMTAATVKSFTVTNPGGNLQVGDRLRIYGNVFSPAMTFGTNDANLTVTAIGTDAQYANNVVLTTVSGSGSGGNITLNLARDTTQSITDYSRRTLSYSVNATGEGYGSGDTVRILGTTLTGVGASPANDLTLRVQSIAGSVTGGERLFAIPITATNSGLLDLRNIKQLGSSAIPGNGVYPDGPEVLAIQITCLTAQATQQFADAQLSFTESPA
jgi:hypothetical protein